MAGTVALPPPRYAVITAVWLSRNCAIIRWNSSMTASAPGAGCPATGKGTCTVGWAPAVAGCTNGAGIATGGVMTNGRAAG